MPSRYELELRDKLRDRLVAELTANEHFCSDTVIDFVLECPDDWQQEFVASAERGGTKAFDLLFEQACILNLFEREMAGS